MMLSGARGRRKPMIRQRNQGAAQQPEGESLLGKSGSVISWKKKKGNLESDLEKGQTTRSTSRSKAKWNLKEFSLLSVKFELAGRTSVLDDIDRKWIIRQPCRRKPNYLIKLQPKGIMSSTPAPAKLPRRQFARKSTGKQYLHKKSSHDFGETSAKKLRLGNYEEPKKPPDKPSEGDQKMKNGSVVESNSKKEIEPSNEPVLIDDLPALTQKVPLGAAISEIAVTPKTNVTPKICENNSVSLSPSPPVLERVPECSTLNCQKDYPDKRMLASNKDHTQECIEQNTEFSDKNVSIKQDVTLKSIGSFKVSEDSTSVLDSFKESIKRTRHWPNTDETKRNVVPLVELTTPSCDVQVINDLPVVRVFDASTPEEPVAAQDNNKLSNNTIDKLRKGLQCGKLKSIVHKVFKDRNEVNNPDQKAAVKQEKHNDIVLGSNTHNNDHQNKAKELCGSNVKSNQVENTSIISDNSSNHIPSEISVNKADTNELNSTQDDKSALPSPESNGNIDSDDNEVEIISTTCGKCNKKRNSCGGNKHLQSSSATLVTKSAKSVPTISQVSDSNKEEVVIELHTGIISNSHDNGSDASNKRQDLTPDISIKEESDETIKPAFNYSSAANSPKAEKMVTSGDTVEEHKIVESDINEESGIHISAVISQKVAVKDVIPIASEQCVSNSEAAAVEIESAPTIKEGNAPLVDKELIVDADSKPEGIIINNIHSKHGASLPDPGEVEETVVRMETDISINDISGSLDQELLTTNQSSLSADEAVASEVAKLIKETSIHNLEQSAVAQTCVQSDSALLSDVVSTSESTISESTIFVQSVHSVTPHLETVGEPSQEVVEQHLTGDNILQKQSNEIHIDVKNSDVTTEQLQLNIVESSPARVDDIHLDVQPDISGKSCSDIVISQIESSSQHNMPNSLINSSETAGVIEQSSNVIHTEVPLSDSDHSHCDRTKPDDDGRALSAQVSLEAGLSHDAEIPGSSTREVIPIIESVCTTAAIVTESSDNSPSVTPVETEMKLDPVPVKIISSTSETGVIPVETGSEAILSSVPMDIDHDKTIPEKTLDLDINSDSAVFEAKADVSVTNDDYSSKRPGSPSLKNNQLSKRLKLDSSSQDMMEEKADPNSNNTNLGAIKELLPEGHFIVTTKELKLMLKKKTADLLKPMVLKLEAVSNALEDYRTKNKKKDIKQPKVQKPEMVSVESQHEKDFFIRAIKEQSYPVLSSFKVPRWKRLLNNGTTQVSDSTNAVSPSTPVTVVSQKPDCQKTVDVRTKSPQNQHKTQHSSPSPTSKPEVHKSPVASTTNTTKSPISKLENMLSTTVPKYTSPCSFLQKSSTMKPSHAIPKVSSPTQMTSTSPHKVAKKSSPPMAVIDLTEDSDDITNSRNTIISPQQTSSKPSGPPPKLIPNRKTVSQQLAPKAANTSALPPLVQSPLLRTHLQTPRAVNDIRMATATPSVRPNPLPQTGPISRMHIPVNSTMKYTHPQQTLHSVSHQQLLEHRNTVHGSTMMTSNPIMAQATSAASQRVMHPSSVSAARVLTSVPTNVGQLLPQTKTANQGILNSTHPGAPLPPQLITQPQTARGFTSQYRQPPPNVSISLMQQTPVQQHRVLQPQSRASFAPPSYNTALNSRTQVPSLMTAPRLQARTDHVIPQPGNTVILQRHPAMQAPAASNNPNRYPVVIRMPGPAQLPASQQPVTSNTSAINSQRHALQLHTTMVRLKETYDNLQNQHTEIIVKLQSKDNISLARRNELLKTLQEIQGNLQSTSQKQKQFQTELTHIHGQSFRNQTPLLPVAAPVVPAATQPTATSQLVALSHQAGVQQRHPQFRLIHPAALPPQPIPAQLPLQAKLQDLPGRPVLNITRAANGIVLSWTMALKLGSAAISFYHLFAYQEQEGPPSSSNWKKIGEVKALPLPMACTLTQFQHGSIYHFSVCAVDIFGRSGEFSENSSINLIN